MCNEILLFVEIIITFSVLVLITKFLKKEGLISWVAIASILANIITAKNVDAFGMTYTLGTVMFASTFLATDILTELYGKECAKKSVVIGMVGTLCLMLFTQISLRYVPSAIDYAHSSMETLFSLNFRISLSSVVMYYVANMLDVYLYDYLRVKFNGKYMWLRNNVATILCNTLENFFFMFGAFIGIFDIKSIFIMAVSTSVVEIIVGLCDTPFLYLAKYVSGKDNV